MLGRIALAAVVASTLNLSVVAPANAQVDPVADGKRCGLASATDPTIEEGAVQTGIITGGPLVATAPGATISMRCTVQVGMSNSTHAGADSCSAATAPQLQSTALPPTLCTYAAPEGQPVFLCTEVTVNGMTWYWDGNPPGTGSWTPSSLGACLEAISQEIVIPFPAQVDDPTACAALQALAPGGGNIYIGWDGDLYILGVWVLDCPPHGNPTTPPPPPCVYSDHRPYWYVNTCDVTGQR